MADDPRAPANLAYAEVWGDTVTLRDLARAIPIGAACALGCFFVAERLLTRVVASAQLARADAMLVGLLGCVAAGAVCARLFPPKRVLGVAGGDDAARDEALDRLAAQPRGLGRIADLPDAVRQEMAALDLVRAFAAREAATALSPASDVAVAEPRR